MNMRFHRRLSAFHAYGIMMISASQDTKVGIFRHDILHSFLLSRGRSRNCSMQMTKGTVPHDRRAGRECLGERRRDAAENRRRMTEHNIVRAQRGRWRQLQPRVHLDQQVGLSGIPARQHGDAGRSRPPDG